jgi:Zn-dependent M28 family amino/carboxypeptidase
LVGERHPATAPQHLTAVENYLAAQLESIGYCVDRQPFEALEGTYRNIVGTRHPSSGPSPHPALLIGAHYDTVRGSPGADDNASALAVLLEAARALATVPLARTIRFVAFGLEEQGLLGSSAYVAALRQQRETLVGAIILECVGYARSEEATQRIPPGLPVAVPTVGNFLAIVGNEASRTLTMAVQQAMGAHVPVVPLIVPGNGEILPDTRRSDHVAFWERGFPAVMLTDTADFRNPHYHQSSDTLDTLNLEFMSQVLIGVVITATRLSAVGGHAA